MIKQELKDIIQESINEVVLEQAVQFIQECPNYDLLIENSLADMSKEYNNARNIYKENMKKAKEYLRSNDIDNAKKCIKSSINVLDDEYKTISRMHIEESGIGFGIKDFLKATFSDMNMILALIIGIGTGLGAAGYVGKNKVDFLNKHKSEITKSKNGQIKMSANAYGDYLGLQSKAANAKTAVSIGATGAGLILGMRSNMKKTKEMLKENGRKGQNSQYRILILTNIKSMKDTLIKLYAKL